MTTIRHGAYGKSVFQITVHFSTLGSRIQIQEIWPYFTNTLITLYRQHILRTDKFGKSISASRRQKSIPEAGSHELRSVNRYDVYRSTRGKIHFSIILLVIHSKDLLAYLYK